MKKAEIENALVMIQANRAFLQESGAPEMDIRALNEDENKLLNMLHAPAEDGSLADPSTASDPNVTVTEQNAAQARESAEAAADAPVVEGTTGQTNRKEKR